MKMKELESRTGVNREAIRYYIREGLLPEPVKPKRNVAEYANEHVERTLLIKHLQDEHFLPLKLVKDVLNKVTQDPSLNTLNRPALTQLLPALIKDTDDQSPSSVARLADATCLTSEDIESMAAVGAIVIGPDGEIAPRDAEIVRLWGAARAVGFTPERGYVDDFMQRYVALAEQWAEIEAQLFLDAFPASESDDKAALAGARGIEIANRLVALLHTNAVLKKIETLTSQQT